MYCQQIPKLNLHIASFVVSESTSVRRRALSLCVALERSRDSTRSKMPPRRLMERKLAIMGYRSVGKSSITLQFAENRFPDSYDPTIANTFSKEVDFYGKRYLLHLLDTAGQDEYSLFPRSYSVGVHGYVLVYAINSRKSFEIVKVIYDKIHDTMGCTGRDGPLVPIILVGNKLDLEEVEREVASDEGKKMAEKWKAGFIETSAKDYHQVKRLFEQLMYYIEKAHGNVPVGGGASSCTLS